MRKSALTILLSCLLVFAQLGAFVHEIAHHGDGVELRHSAHGDAVADSLCALCLAFAQLAAFARPAAPAVPLAAAPPGLLALALPEGRSAIVARGRNRDPPPAA